VELSYVVARKMEQTLGLAAIMFRAAMNESLERSWDQVFDMVQRRCRDLEQAMACDVADFRGVGVPRAAPAWAREGGAVCIDLVMRYTGRGRAKEIIESFGLYFQSPRPEGRAVVNFSDASLLLDSDAVGVGRIRQIQKSPMNHCYFGLPVALSFKSPDWVDEKMRVFLATSFAGNEAGRVLDIAMEALCWYDELVPQVQLPFTGHGGNAKSAKTILRGNVFGEAAMVMSPEVFQVPEEFRKQGCHFAFAKVVTHQECNPGVPLVEDVWKKFVSGEALACRPLFGKTTEYFSWKKTGKYLEWNLAFPSIKGEYRDMASLRAFWRRLVVIRLHSTFSGDTSLVDPEKKVFLEDSTMTEFLAGPYARLSYITRFLFPFIRTHTPTACRDILKNPPAEIVAETKRVVAQMANGGVELPSEIASPGDAQRAQAAAKALMEKIHSSTAGRTVLKTYELGKLKCIPGVYQASGRSKSRLQNFDEAFEHYPYLFDRMDRDIIRLNVDLGKLAGLLAMYSPEELAGTFADWGSFGALKRAAADCHVTNEIVPEHQEEAADDRCSGSLLETINVVALAEHLEDLAGDDREMAAQVVDRFRNGIRTGDYATVEVQYYRKHGLGGRQYARGPSAQKLSRTARKYAFFSEAEGSQLGGAVFLDVDIANCFPCLLWNTLSMAKGSDAQDEFPVLCALAHHHRAWRSFLAAYLGCNEDEAKKVITTIFHLGRPRDDLPLLWALAVEQQKAIRCLLSLPENAHLNNKFTDRPHPLATRLHYALSAVEDRVMADVEQAFLEAGLAQPIVVRMFDGCITRVPTMRVATVHEALEKVSEQWSVAFKVDRFA
jgi:hypothetical protein